MKSQFGHSCTSCKCLGCPCQFDGELDGIVKLKPEITYNNNRTHPNGKKAPNGIEIRFGATRPTTEVREMLKAHGFRFSEKQTIWYAIENTKSKELANYLENNEIEADDTQLEKRNFWAKVSSLDFYNKLRNYTEFKIIDTPPRFFYNKKQLEKSVNPREYLFSDRLRFKKFYNKVVGEDEEGEEQNPEEEETEETEERDEENEDEENEDGEEQPEERPSKKRAKGDQALAIKLKDMADAMQKQIDTKINSATSKQRPTPKRMRVAAGMRNEGYYLRNIQVVLYALSEAHKAGVIGDYPLLENVRSKAQVEILNKFHDAHMRKEEDHYLKSVFNNNKSTFEQLGIRSLSMWDSANAQKEELLSNINPKATHKYDEKAEKIREMEMEIKSMKIPGFFPTPKDLIAEVLAWSAIEKNITVLEPSAGKGDILDAIKDKFGNTVDLYACELNSTLRKLLDLKGYEVLADDFLELDQKFDRIIMNPPFENGKDVEHVTHALNLLNPGGRVVAIMSEGVFFRKFNKDNSFRLMLADQNAYVSQPIKNAFKDAFNQTGVNVRIVAINKDGTLPEPSDDFEGEEEEEEEESEEENITEDDADEMERLELEAEAELEIMKMNLELEKRKKGLNGLGNTKQDKLNELRQMAKDLGDYPDVWNFN